MLRGADRRVVGDIYKVIIPLCLALGCQHWHWTVLGTKISEALLNWEESRGGKSKRKEAKENDQKTKSQSRGFWEKIGGNGFVWQEREDKE